MTAASTSRVIGIDGSRATVGQRTGTERYSVELLAALAALDPPDDIRVYLNAAERPENLQIPGLPVPIPGPRFWTVRNLALEMRRDPPALLFVPSHVLPPIHPPSVVTIHDLGYLAEPESHEPIHRKQLDWTTRWNARAANGIIAVSQTTRRDLIDRLDVPPDRIQVIYHGVSSNMKPATPDQVHSLRVRHGVGPRFVLALGTIHPRKNLIRLIQAFERLAATDPQLELILCGAAGWNGVRILDRAKASPFHQRIHHLGYLPDAELPALYSAASVLAFPSLYEGFGMPALEAMACGTPVVAANRSSLPEICDNAAILVDPFDSADIARGIERVLLDKSLRSELRVKGFARSAQFRWRDCASHTLAFLRSFGDN